MNQQLNVDEVLKPYIIKKEVVKPGRDTYIVEPTKIRDVMQFLKNNFNNNIYLATIAAVDKLKENIYELNYFVHIISLGKTIIVKTSIPKGNPRIDTVVDIMPGAYSAEAEVFDLFGIEFVGNKYLRRGFFTPLDVVSKGVYPLRKDAQV